MYRMATWGKVLYHEQHVPPLLVRRRMYSYIILNSPRCPADCQWLYWNISGGVGHRYAVFIATMLVFNLFSVREF